VGGYETGEGIEAGGGAERGQEILPQWLPIPEPNPRKGGGDSAR